MSVRLVLLGPPGVGKGSLASLLEKRLGMSHVSTGELFRQEIARGSKLGSSVKRYVSTGRLVPDDLVVQVMMSRLSAKTLKYGIVLDGFPRTRGQAIGFDRELKRRGIGLDGAIVLESPMHLLIRRLSLRRVCPQCGATYNVRTMPPKQSGRCDECHARLVARKDDQPSMIQRRLEIDKQASAPLIAHYRRKKLLYELNGSGKIETVYHRALALMKRQGWLQFLKPSRSFHRQFSLGENRMKRSGKKSLSRTAYPSRNTDHKNAIQQNHDRAQKSSGD